MADKADRIIAFEPNPESLKSICDKVNLNRLTNIDLVPVGLGARDDELTYYVRSDCNSGAGTFCEQDDLSSYSKSLTLSIRQGDQVCDELHLPPVDLLKIDVEGFEQDVLAGLKEHILESRPVILMELSDCSRKAFGSEHALLESLYPSAAIAEVKGRSGCPYKLHPFQFESANEILIVPPERLDFIESKMHVASVH